VVYDKNDYVFLYTTKFLKPSEVTEKLCKAHACEVEHYISPPYVHDYVVVYHMVDSLEGPIALESGRWNRIETPDQQVPLKDHGVDWKVITCLPYVPDLTLEQVNSIMKARIPINPHVIDSGNYYNDMVSEEYIKLPIVIAIHCNNLMALQSLLAMPHAEGTCLRDVAFWFEMNDCLLYLVSMMGDLAKQRFMKRLSDYVRCQLAIELGEASPGDDIPILQERLQDHSMYCRRNHNFLKIDTEHLRCDMCPTYVTTGSDFKYVKTTDQFYVQQINGDGSVTWIEEPSDPRKYAVSQTKRAKGPAKSARR
jgi:hypothetical protein